MTYHFTMIDLLSRAQFLLAGTQFHLSCWVVADFTQQGHNCLMLGIIKSSTTKYKSNYDNINQKKKTRKTKETTTKDHPLMHRDDITATWRSIRYWITFWCFWSAIRTTHNEWENVKLIMNHADCVYFPASDVDHKNVCVSSFVCEGKTKNVKQFASNQMFAKRHKKNWHATQI